MPRMFTLVALLLMGDRIPAPSVDSTMAGSLEPTPPGDGPALVAPTEAALTEAAGDSSQEVIKP